MGDSVMDPPVSLAQPLSGKVVVVVHPAWPSCGSHQVFVSQVRAYRSLGAQVISLALGDLPGRVEGSRASKAYFAATGDLDADVRTFAGMPLGRILNGGFLGAVMPWLHGNYAKMRLEVARLTALPEMLGSLPRIDLIHCNHFFSVLAANRLRGRRDCPVVLDTHDLQARQSSLLNRASFRLSQAATYAGPRLPPLASYEEMLELELDAMRLADILVHLNNEEAAQFQKLVPDKRHALLYPAVSAKPVGPGGGDPIIVASRNHPNFLDLSWFLREILPRAPDVPVQIFGDIDREFFLGAPSLFKANAALFRGRVGANVLAEAYCTAAAVLLPTMAGHGISIKTIEALSCGAPLIATPLAFRGLSIDPGRLANVTLAKDAEDFASALCRVYAERHLSPVDRASCATRQIYELHFSADAYRRSLWATVGELLRS